MTSWWQASDAELLVALGESNRELNAAYPDVLEVVGEVSARGAPTWLPGGPRRNPLHRIDLLPAADRGPDATTGHESTLRTILRQ